MDTEPGDSIYAYINGNHQDKYIKVGKAENIKDAYMVGDRGAEILYYRKCFDCKLTEKVVHHILDKYRVNSTMEWFDISEELAIYTIDIVCDFLDSFISTSEQFVDSKLKEYLFTVKSSMTEDVREKDVTEDVIEDVIEDMTEDDSEDDSEDENIVNNKKPKVETDIQFKRFVAEFCEEGPKMKCLSLELLGAYRMWNKKMKIDSRKMLTTYMKKNYKFEQQFLTEYNTKLSFFIGIRPKAFVIERENENILPKYEEFVLSECKFGYTYRTSKTALVKAFKEWIKQYPEYSFSKLEQTHMNSYLGRMFLNCLKLHVNGGTNGYYGLQLKSDTSEITGVLILKRKQVFKIDANTQEQLEVFESLIVAAEKLGFNYAKLSEYVLSETVIDSYYLRYAK